MFENPYGDPVNGPYRLHQPSYVALANQAERESITLLKNDGILPLQLHAGDNIIVSGPRATDAAACCIWTSYFHPEYGSQDILRRHQVQSGDGRGQRVPGHRPGTEAGRGGGRRGVVHARDRTGRTPSRTCRPTSSPSSRTTRTRGYRWWYCSCCRAPT